MKFLLTNILFLLLSVPGLAQIATDAENDNIRARKTLQKFNPIYGSQSETNEIIRFISANLAVELDNDQLHNVNGKVICAFVVDTMGNIGSLSVVKSLNPWVDYAIISAMKQLPPWGVPSIRRSGKIEKRFEVVFSFGTTVSQFAFGYQQDLVTSRTQLQIDEQRTALSKELTARKERWDGFTKQNAKLKYDNRGAMRRDQSTLPGTTSPLNPLDAIPSMSPTVSISAPKE